MMEKINNWLFSPPVRNFVTAHPFLVWAVLAIVLSSLILVPVLLRWPKKVK